MAIETSGCVLTPLIGIILCREKVMPNVRFSLIADVHHLQPLRDY
jgi:hypothetical protein